MDSLGDIMSQRFYRPLGSLEQMFWLQHQAHPVQFALVAQFEGTVSARDLRRALDKVKAQHPLLRCRIVVDENGLPWFAESMTKIPLKETQRWGEKHWQREVERELSMPLDATQSPLLRATLVRGAISELILTFHHSIADGVSASFVVHDLLQALGDPSTQPKPLPVPPALDEILVDQVSETHVESCHPKSISQVEHFIAPSTKPAIRMAAHGLSKATTSSLVSVSRQKKASVHSAVCAAFLLTLASRNQIREIETLRCLSPISTRSYLRDDGFRHVGVYIAAHRTAHSVDDCCNFWEVARSVKQQLIEGMTSDTIYRGVSEARSRMLMRPRPKEVFDAFAQHMAHDVAVTNLKQLKIPQQISGIHLKAVYGPVVLAGLHKERSVGVSTVGDQLFLTLASPTSIDGPRPINILTRAVRLLEAAVV